MPLPTWIQGGLAGTGVGSAVGIGLGVNELGNRYRWDFWNQPEQPTQPVEPLPPTGGFTKHDYLRLIKDSLAEQEKAGKITAGQKKTILKEYTDLVNGTTPFTPEYYPQFNELENFWAVETGQYITEGLIKAKDGTYRTPDGAIVDPYTAEYAINEYFGKNQGKLSEADMADLRFKRDEALRDQQNFERQLGMQLTPEQQLEQDRLKVLAGTDNPRGWIVQSLLRNPQRAPFDEAANRTNWLQRSMQDTKSQAEGWRGAAIQARLDLAGQMANAEYDTNTPSPDVTASIAQINYYEEQAKNLEKAYKQEQKAYESAKEASAQSVLEATDMEGNVGGGSAWLSRFQMPMIPKDVSKLAGFGGRVPEATNQTEFITPSAQKFNNASLDTRQMYAGLVDWAGKRTFNDIYNQMQTVLPRSNPRLGGWIPVKQRI